MMAWAGMKQEDKPKVLVVYELVMKLKRKYIFSSDRRIQPSDSESTIKNIHRWIEAWTAAL